METVPAISAPSRRSALKHRAILDAAIEAVSECGYAGVSIENIAVRAGVAKQTIYRWWPNKAALFVEVYSDLMAPDGLRSPKSGAQESTPYEELRGLLRSVFRLFKSTPAGRILAGLIGDATSDEAARDAVNAGLVSGRRDILLDIMERAEHRNALTNGLAPKEAGELVVALIWKRLVAAPESLTLAYADRLAALAIEKPA